MENKQIKLLAHELLYLKQALSRWKHAEELISGGITAFSKLGNPLDLDLKFVDFGTMKRSAIDKIEMHIERCQAELDKISPKILNGQEPLKQ